MALVYIIFYVYNFKKNYIFSFLDFFKTFIHVFSSSYNQYDFDIQFIHKLVEVFTGMIGPDLLLWSTACVMYSRTVMRQMTGCIFCLMCLPGAVGFLKEKLNLYEYICD